MDRKEVLKQAQELYSKGKWQEGFDLISENWYLFYSCKDKSDFTKACKIAGWCAYYLGTKGPEDKRNDYLKQAELLYAVVATFSPDKEIIISAKQGLPLVLWCLEKKSEAWEVINEALSELPEEPPLWNTKSILHRWAGEYEAAVITAERVSETAIAKGDYRTAGNGKVNKADTLVKLGRIPEAKTEYAEALKLYQESEKRTGQSAKFHIDGIEKKLADLQKSPLSSA